MGFPGLARSVVMCTGKVIGFCLIYTSIPSFPVETSPTNFLSQVNTASTGIIPIFERTTTMPFEAH